MSLPRGFKFSGVACGIKPSGSQDLAIISTDEPCVAAGVYTQNVVRASSIDWNRQITPSDSFRAVVINSGNANACTGQKGIDDNQQIAVHTAQKIGATPQQVMVLSTGVIGHLLPMDKIESGIDQASAQLSDTQASFDAAANSILTTDQGPKTNHRPLEINGSEIQISGMAKGAGMIGPNMATMLALVMTDAKIDSATAQSALATAAKYSFNRISVEGHTSTNDALLLICSGSSGTEISTEPDIESFTSALTESCIDLAKRIPSDGEGASHLVTIKISGAASDDEADRAARTIAASALVKTAVTGADPNWGRIVSAAGYSGVAMDVDQSKLEINGHCLFDQGQPIAFDETSVSHSIKDNFETEIDLRIGLGPGSATHWTSDLTVQYVRFNSEYTS